MDAERRQTTLHFVGRNGELSVVLGLVCADPTLVFQVWHQHSRGPAGAGLHLRRGITVKVLQVLPGHVRSVQT